MKNIKVVIFDFDGTIADSLPMHFNKIIDLAKKRFSVDKKEKDLYLQIDKIKIFPGMAKLLKNLKENNYKIGILSSNMQRNVNKFIKINRLDFFDIVYCESNILGKDKTIKKMMKKYALKTEEIIYVGDEIRDIVACHKMGIKMIGVSWGLHTVEALQKNEVNYIAKKPHEILKL